MTIKLNTHIIQCCISNPKEKSILIICRYTFRIVMKILNIYFLKSFSSEEGIFKTKDIIRLTTLMPSSICEKK